MFIKDGIYRSIKPQVALPIAEGTVLTINGLAATADTAYGIVPANITAISPTNQIYVAVSGTIDLKDPANKAVSFSEDMIKALGKDFNFVPAEEYPDRPIPPIEAGDSGKVLTAGDDGQASWQTLASDNPIKTAYATGTATAAEDRIIVQTNLTVADLLWDPISDRQITPVIVALPEFSLTSPYYSYEEGTHFYLASNFMAESYKVGSFDVHAISDQQDPQQHVVFMAVLR